MELLTLPKTKMLLVRLADSDPPTDSNDGRARFFFDPSEHAGGEHRGTLLPILKGYQKGVAPSCESRPDGGP